MSEKYYQQKVTFFGKGKEGARKLEGETARGRKRLDLEGISTLILDIRYEIMCRYAIKIMKEAISLVKYRLGFLFN